MKQEEPRLCPDCPMKSFMREAVRRIMDRQYIAKEQPSNLRICAELRIMMKEMNPSKSCPYYSESENMLHYM